MATQTGWEGRIAEWVITQPPQTDEALGLRASVTAGQELQCNSVIINWNFEASQSCICYSALTLYCNTYRGHPPHLVEHSSEHVHIPLFLRCKQRRRSVSFQDQVWGPRLWFVAEAGSERIKDVAEQRGRTAAQTWKKRWKRLLWGVFHKPQSIVLILAWEKFVMSFHVLLNYIVNAWRFLCVQFICTNM